MSKYRYSRRKFLKMAGALGATTACAPLFTSAGQWNRSGIGSNPADSDYPFPYDSNYFDASERIVFLDTNTLSLNILPKDGANLDIRVTYPHEDRISIQSRSINFTGVKSSLEIPLPSQLWDPVFNYRIEYRQNGESSWKATPLRNVKTPLSYLQTGKMEIILIGDDHVPDDADMGETILEDQTLRDKRLSGEYVNDFIQELLRDPTYYPDPDTEYAKLMNGFTFASMVHQIYKNENPDFIVHLGDHRGGFGHKWLGLGLKGQFDMTDPEMDQVLEMFRIGTRKVFSALSPNIPIYWTLGNHDGELGYQRHRGMAVAHRKRLFKQPGAAEGGSADENYFPLFWGQRTHSRGDWINTSFNGILFMFLDSQGYVTRFPTLPSSWTLGQTQKQWFENILKTDAMHKFVFQHHVLGGWPAGPDEGRTDIAYGRGPLFIQDDYKGLVTDPTRIEQVELTQMMKDARVNNIFYGHDHIFYSKEIGREINGHKLHGLCVGSPKHVGEIPWYEGDFFRQFYGDYGDYGGDDTQADFWGPSGYTKVTIDKDGVRADYIRSADNNPYTNIPRKFNVGDTIHSILY
ncbi:metallophosphoesterase [Acidobacteriota bacterium]